MSWVFKKVGSISIHNSKCKSLLFELEEVEDMAEERDGTKNRCTPYLRGGKEPIGVEDNCWNFVSSLLPDEGVEGAERLIPILDKIPDYIENSRCFRDLVNRETEKDSFER